MRALFLLAWPAFAVDFAKDVAPILESSCLGCHGADKSYGGLRLTSAESAMKGGARGKAIIAGKPDQSLLYTLTMIPANRAGAMPPGGPALTQAETDMLRHWIAEGAKWPADLALKQRGASQDEMAVVKAIHGRIAAPPKSFAEMKPYKLTIPGADVAFEMVPIPGGEFTMGTPDAESGHRADEGPRHKVKIEPFWMGKFEVTWDEYRLFMFPQKTEQVDAISRPTRPYVEMSFGMGLNGFPAIIMTQHAASKYAEWLSARTNRFYRLPTEAEWEYACRAGTDTAYSFGDDASKLGEYAWFNDNANGKYQKVGQKKPNPWGLHDMHGNVFEWTLDQYNAGYYSKSPAVAPWARATEPYPHTARGGSWLDDAEKLRCGARVGSDPSWKMQDPQLPKSIWYMTDAQGLGFRVIRPMKVPAAAEMYRYWNSGVEKE